MADDAPETKPRNFRAKIWLAANNNLAATVLGGLLLAVVSPFVTGFANWTFSARSWETFGAANEASAPGAYLSDDSVYRLPFGERFRVDADLYLAVSQSSSGAVYASLSLPNGDVESTRINTGRSLVAENDCKRVAVHLMREPERDASEAYVAYSTSRIRSEECSGFLQRIFG
ncbi:hypothetical protein [Salipiger thiooxidans]|uniref:hypothetical protein n=1 Tax=Salipiger thiooxidans TaxID=282683 RepID=UPI001CFBCB0B|nr:hypothetical protein [Salipiger thiooxidans]